MDSFVKAITFLRIYLFTCIIPIKHVHKTNIMKYQYSHGLRRSHRAFSIRSNVIWSMISVNSIAISHWIVAWLICFDLIKSIHTNNFHFSYTFVWSSIQFGWTWVLCWFWPRFASHINMHRSSVICNFNIYTHFPFIIEIVFYINGQSDREIMTTLSLMNRNQINLVCAKRWKFSSIGLLYRGWIFFSLYKMPID